MTPSERLQEGLEQTRNQGCNDNSTVNQTRRDYERQADEADRQLREKQAQDLRRFWG